MKQNIIKNILDQAEKFLVEEEKNIQEKYGIETNGPFVTNESALNLKNEAEWIKTLGSVTEKEKLAIEKHLDKMAVGNDRQKKDQQKLYAQLDEAKNVLNSLEVVEKTVRKREIARELAYKQELANFVKTKNEIDKRIQNINNIQDNSKAEKEAVKLQREIENFHPKISTIIPSAPSSPNFEKSKLVKKTQQDAISSRSAVASRIKNNSSWKKNRISWDTETTGLGNKDLPVTLGLAGYNDKGQKKKIQYFLSYGSKRATAEKIEKAVNILNKDGKGYYDSALQLRALLGLDQQKTITAHDIEAIYEEKILPHLITPRQLSQKLKGHKLDKMYSYNGAFDVEMIKRWINTKGVAPDKNGELQQILESNIHIDLMKEVEKAFIDENGQSLLIANPNKPDSKIKGITQLQSLRKLLFGNSSSSAHDAMSDAEDTTELAYYLENGLLEGLVKELQHRVQEKGIQIRKNNAEFTQEYVNFVRNFFDEMNGVVQGGAVPPTNTPNSHLVAKFEKLGYDVRNLANGKLSVDALKEKIVSEYGKVGIGVKFEGNKMGLFPLNKGINPDNVSIDDMASVEMATLDEAFALRRGKQALSNPTYIDQEWLDGVLTPVIYSGYEGQYLHILKQLGATPENSKLVQAILNDDKDKANAIMGIGVKEATSGVPTAASQAVKNELNKTLYGKKTPEQMMITAGLYNTNRLAETVLGRKNKDTDKYIVQELYDEFFKQGIIKEAKTFDPYDLKGEEYSAINAAFGLLAANLIGDEFNVAQIRAETGGGDSLLNRLINDERFSQFRDIVKYFASQGLVPKNSAIKEESVIAGYYNSIGSEDILPLNIFGDPSNRALAQIFNYNERAGSDITGIESTGRNMLFSSEKGRAWGVDYDKAEFKQYRGAQVTDEELFEALKQISNAAEYTYASVTEGGMVISASMAKELGSYREQNYEAYLEDIQQDFLNRAGLTVSQLNEAQAGTFFDFNNQLITDLTDTTFTSKFKLSSGDVIVGLEKLADGFKLITKKLEHVGTGSKGLGEHGGRHTFRVIDDATWAQLKKYMGLSADTQFLVERDSLEVRKIMPMLRGRLSYLIHEAMEKSNGKLSMEQVFQALQKTTQIGKGMSLVDGKLESSIYYDSNTHSYKYGNGESVFDTDENGEVLEEALKRAYLENTDDSDFKNFFYKMLEMGGIDQAKFSGLYESTYRKGADGFNYYYFDQFINKANEVPYYTKIGSGNVDFFESEGRVKFADRERRAIARSYANSVNAMSSDDLKEGLRLLSEDDKRQTTAGQGRLSKQAISNIEMINKAISNVQTNPSTTGESVLSGGYTNVGDYVSIERGPEGWIIRSKDNFIDSSDLSTEMKYGEDGATGISKEAYEKTIMAKARALAQQNGKDKALDIVLDTGTSRFLLPDIEAVQGHDNSYMPSITDRINNKLFKAGDRGKLEEAIREVFGYKGEYYTAANDKDSSLVKAATEAYVGNSGYSKIVGFNTSKEYEGNVAYNDMEMNEDDVRDMLSIAKNASQEDRAKALRNLAYEANAMGGSFNINQLQEDENVYIDYIVERMKNSQKLISQFHRYPSTSGLDIKYGNIVLNNTLDKGSMATSRGLSLMVNADYDGDSIWNRLVLANSDFNTQDDYNKARAAALELSRLDNEVAKRMEEWENGKGKTYVEEEEKLLKQLKDPAAMHYASFTSKHNKEYVGKFSNIATNVRNFAQDIGIDEAMRGGTREAASASLVRAFLESLEQDSISAKKVYARLIDEKGETAAFEELSVLYGKLAEGKLQEVYEDAQAMGLDFQKGRQFELIKNNLAVYQPELYEEITKGAEEGTALLNLLYEGFALITQSAKNEGMEWRDVVYQTKSRKSILNKVKKKMGNDRAKKASEVLSPPSNTQETKATIKLAEDAVNRFVSGIAKNTDEINHKRSVSVDNVTYADEGVFSVTELINQFDDTVPKSREQELAMKKSAAKGTFAHRLSEILSSIVTQDADGNISIDRESKDYLEAVARLGNELTKLGDPYGVTEDMLADLEARALSLNAAIMKHQGDSDYIIGAGTEREKTLGGKFAGVSDKAVAGQADIITYSDKGVTVADYKFSNQGGDATLAKRKLQSSIYMALEEKEIESALNELTNSGNLDEEQKAKKAELEAKLAAFKKDRKIVIARNYERNGNLYDEIVEMQALETEKALEYLEGLGITKEALLELRKLEEKAKQAEKNGLTLSAEDEERRKALQELFDTAVRPTGRDILGDKSDIKTTTYNAQLEQVDVDDLERKAEKKAQAKAISSYLAQEKNINRAKERLARAQAGLSGKTGDELIAQQEYLRAAQKELALLESRQLQFDAQGKTLGEISLSEEQVNQILQERLLLDRQHESALLKINATTKQSEGLLSKMIGGFKQQVVQFLDYSLAYQAVGYIKQGISAIIVATKQLDAAMVDIQIATGNTRAETRDLMLSYAELGAELGRTTQSIAQASNDWLRAGYQGKEATELTRASMMLSTLGMIDASSATTYLISTLKGWKISASEVIDVVDKLTAVDMAAAVSAGDLALAMSRANNSARLAGSDMNKFIGYVTTVADVTQKSAESVGESFKTIYSRFGNVKTNKFAASYEDQVSGDYNSEDFENLNDIETVLDRVGIKLRENASTWRDIDLVLEDIAANWKNWDRTTQNAVATAVAGTRQRENVITLFENWDSVAKYAEIAENAYGTATEKMAAYTESIEASKEKMTAAIEEWSLKLNQSDAIEKFYDSLTFLIKNIHTISLTLAGLGLATNFQKVSKLLFSGLTKVSTKMLNLGGKLTYRRDVNNAKGWFASTKDSFVAAKGSMKEALEQDFVFAQQEAYGSTLNRYIKVIDAKIVADTQSLQSGLLLMDSEGKATTAELFNANMTWEDTQATIQKLSATNRKILADTLAAQVTDQETQATIESIRKDQTLSAAEQDLQIATILLTQKRKEMASIPTGSQMFNQVGANLGNASKQNMKSSVLGGAGTLLGGALGAYAGSALGDIPFLGDTGKTVGTMVGGLGGSMALQAVMSGAAGFLPWVSIGVMAGSIIYKIRASIKQKAREEAQEEFKELEEKLSSTKSMTTVAAKFDELSKGVDKFGHNVNLSEEDYQSFLETSNQLCDTIPQLTGYIDEQGNKIVDLGKNAQTAAEYVAELTKEQQEAADAALIDPDVMVPAMKEAFANYKEIWNKIQDKKSNVERKKQSLEYWENIQSLGEQDEELYPDILAALKLITTNGITSKEEWLNTLTTFFGNNKQRVNIVATMASSYLGTEFWGKDEQGRRVSVANAITGVSNYGARLGRYDEEEVVAKIQELKDELDLLTNTSGEALGVAQWERELEQLEQTMAPYGQAVARQMNTFENLTSEKQSVITSLIPNISMVRKLENGKIELIDQDEYINKVEELVSNLSQLFTKNPALVKVATEVEIAPTIKQENEARQNLLITALKAMNEDGVIDKSDLFLLESWQFKHNGGSSYTVNDFTDTTDKYQQLADALGISETIMGNHVATGNNVAKRLNIGDMSLEEFNKLYSYVKNGEITSNTNKKTIERLMYSDSFGGNTLEGAQKYRDQLLTIQTKTLEARVKDLYDMDMEITKANVAYLFSDLPENLRNAIFQGVEEGRTDFENVWSDIQAAYDAALLGSYEQLAKVQASTYFSNIEAGSDEVLSTWSEINDMMGQVADAFNLLTEATKEYEEIGKLSWQTILKLLETNKDYVYALALDSEGGIGFDFEEAQRITVEGQVKAIRDNIYSELETLKANRLNLKERKDELGSASIKTAQTEVELKLINDQLDDEAKKIETLSKLWEQLGDDNIAELFNQLYNSDRKTQLDKLKDGLGAINKEFQQMMAFSDMLAKSLDTTLDPNKVNFIDTNYYDAKRRYLEDLINEAKEKLGGKTLDKIMKIEDDAERDEYLGYYQDYQNYTVEKNNLDDERVQDSINILKGQKADLSLVTAQYKNLIQTADTEEEYYEYYQQYLDAFMAEFDKKIDDVQRNIDALEKSKPQEWKSTIDDNGKILEFATDKIKSYYRQMDDYYNQQYLEAQNALAYAAELTEDEINKLVDSANDALKSIRDNDIAEAEALKEYQEAVYNALRNEVERYIDELNKQKEVIEETYDKELEKLEDKEDAIARTNKLIELQNNLMTAQKEKERVYRAGIGWTYESNRNKVREAEKALNDFYRQDNIDDLNNAKDAELKNLEDRIKNWENYLDMLEEKYKEYEILEERRLLKELLNVETDGQIKEALVQDMTNLITGIGLNYDTFVKDQSTFYSNYNSTFSTFLDDYNKNLELLAEYKSKELDLLNSSDYSVGLDNLDYWKNTDFSALADAAETEEEMLKYLALRDLKVDKYGLQGNIDSGEYRDNEKIAEQWYAKHGYSSGILNGPVSYTGLAMLHGTPSNPEYVLNNDQAYNLLRYMATKKMPAFESTNCGNSGAQYIVQGDIVLEGVNNPQEFWGEVTKAMSNRWNVTKNR